MKSLYSGVAGMKTHNQRMDVIGNNISNVNTTGYKTSEVTFKDVYYQTKGNASSGDATSGGKNPTQIGYGSQLGTVSQVMVQSGFTYSDSVFNCALQGEGFFQVMDEAGNIYYTRAGKFSVDSFGNLCDPNGNMVLGVAGDPSNVEVGQSQRINLKVPAIDNNKASCTKNVRQGDNVYDITISAAGYGEQGNISFTIVDSDTPFATRSGSNLTIYMDLDKQYGDAYFSKIDEAYPDGEFTTSQTININGNDITINNQEELDSLKEEAVEAARKEFEDSINEAIRLGGVGLDDNVVPLSVEFGTLPKYEEVRALQANNTIKFAYDTDSSGTKTTNELTLKFTANNACENANKYEVDIKVGDSSKVVAKWNGNDVLTITVPKDGKVGDAPEGWTGGTYTLVDAINEAIKKVSNDDHLITVEKVAFQSIAPDGTATDLELETNEFDFVQALQAGTSTRIDRLGLDNGRDNFFSDIATALSTVTLTDGRIQKEQAVDDLEVIQIDTDGTIYGRHAVHGTLLLGRIDVATFENPMGLEQCGTSLWRASLASGEAQVKIAGKDGAGQVIQSALEMSNVDLAQEFSDMIITQRGYQANSRVITVSDTMLEELVNLKR